MPPMPGAGASITGPGAILPQIKSPIGGSPLFSVGALENLIGAVQVTIYARTASSQVWQAVFTWTATDERMYRLPAGFKADGWRVQLIGNIPVYSFAMAETGKELQQV